MRSCCFPLCCGCLPISVGKQARPFRLSFGCRVRCSAPVTHSAYCVSAVFRPPFPFTLSLPLILLLLLQMSLFISLALPFYFFGYFSFFLSSLSLFCLRPRSLSLSLSCSLAHTHSFFSLLSLLSPIRYSLSSILPEDLLVPHPLMSSLLLRLQCNAHRVTVANNLVGLALYPPACYLNHSCTPNSVNLPRHCCYLLVVVCAEQYGALVQRVVC